MNSSTRPGIYIPSIPASGTTRWLLDDLSVRIDDDMVADSDLEDSDTINAVLAEQLAIEESERLRLETERRIQEAYTNGYDEGRLDGEIAEAARLRHAVAAAEMALNDIHENEVAWQSSIQENIAALSIAIARHIVGRELRTDAGAVADLVRRALAEFPIDQPMRIRVNPHDLALLSTGSLTNGGPPSIAPNRDVRWMADARVTPGGCLVEGRERIIDGRIDTALERLYRRMTYTDV